MITIINLTPNENGTYAHQSFDFKMPDNWAIVPQGLEEMVNLLPHVNLELDTVGNIIDITDNPEAREAAEESRKTHEAQRLANDPTAALQAQVALLTELLQADLSKLTPEQIERHQPALQALGAIVPEAESMSPIEDGEAPAPKKGKGK